MVEKDVGKFWSVRYYRECKMVEVLYKNTVVISKLFERVCDTVNFYAKLKTVSDIKKLQE